MRHLRQGCLRRQLQFFQRQYLQDGDLSFSNVLSEDIISQALTAIEANWNHRIYTPLVTLWVFLNQVISADHSCRGAVARLIAHRVSQGMPACSSNTGAYCQARKRLPEQFFAIIARAVGRKLEDQAEEEWLWKGHHVYMFDGTTTVMPDTKENREAYPPTSNSKTGAGMPLTRIGAVFSLACGVVLDLATAKYAGKGQGEVTLLRQLSPMFSKGDVLLADCLMSDWRNLYEFQERGIHIVSRLNRARRKADFRKGKSLGKDDHLVQWPKPHLRGVGRKAQLAMPRQVMVREARVHVSRPGFRTKVIIVVTTLLDPVRYTKEELAELYRQRWNIELDIRSLKTVMQMERLRCKTPELVRKEIWTHVLAYNLVRAIMAQAAIENDVMPRTISFKAALQVLEAFQTLIAITQQRCADRRRELHQQILEAIATHRVADRPNRFEPRRLKRKSSPYPALVISRAEAKRQIRKGLTKN